MTDTLSFIKFPSEWKIYENKIIEKVDFDNPIFFSNFINYKEKNHQKVTLKEFKKDTDDIKALSNEIQICSTLDNSNIVKMLDITENNNKQYLIYEFCNGGDLKKYLKYFGNFDEELIQIILYE